ncbi:MAG: hypothetical protein JF605_23475, partial [Burkholderia sp.]|nr:hypothetical protein [Burkholderia sp.]
MPLEFMHRSRRRQQRIFGADRLRRIEPMKHRVEFGHLGHGRKAQRIERRLTMTVLTERVDEAPDLQRPRYRRQVACRF